jgi:hypothetical protein
VAGIASVETTQEIGSKENYDDGPEPDAGATTVTPAAVAVVPSATPKNQQQNDNEYQHIGYSFPLNVSPQPDWRKLVLPATVFIRRGDWLVRSIVLRYLFLIAQIEFVPLGFPKESIVGEPEGRLPVLRGEPTSGRASLSTSYSTGRASKTIWRPKVHHGFAAEPSRP